MKSLWCLLLASVLTSVAGQAPGDEQELCTVSLPALGQNVVEDPPNGKILMDSSHYERLLAPNSDPVWLEVDLDDNNPTGILSSWTEQGSNCESHVTVCGWSGGDQDNWLFTQHISRTVDGYHLQYVSVQIEYQQTICPDSSVGGTRCRRTFDLSKYETSTVNPVAAMNTSNYALIQTLTTQVSGTGTGTGTTTIAMENFGFNTDESGFYLAIRDGGTCIIISRLIVFYNVCPGETVNFAMRPETLAPTVGSLNVNASCVDNSSPVGDDFSLTCLESGNWVVGSSRCECDTGFVPTMNGENCLSCDPGFYAGVVNGECLTCPNNSNSTTSGLAVCTCDDGYYRTQQEVDLSCTLPPSPPLNVREVSRSSTTIMLAWEEPLSTGGRNRTELRYNLWFRAAGETSITLRNTVTTTTGTIDGLTPEVVYTVFVTSETDITSLIPGNNEESSILARGGSPITITLLALDIAVVVGVVVGVLAVIGILILVVVLLFCCLWRQKKIVKETISHYAEENSIALPKIGKRMYVDPTTYTSPDDAVKDFASEIPPKVLRLMEDIGSGEFGDVYKGTWKSEGKQIPVAVKTLKPGSSRKMKNDFLTEASIMGQFDHPNVIKLYGVVTRVEPAMIVMEFVDNGSLYHYLRKNDDHLSVERQVKMARCVAAGMDYLSTVGFVHRDLAARNVLVGKDETCKVADFGLSRETVDDEYDVKKGGKIPVRWTAPEAIFRRRFTSASDVWSYGVLLWEVMSYGQHPYEAEDWDNQTVLDKLEAGYRLENPHGCPQSVYNLMLNCWCAEKNDRPTFADIVKYLDQLLENNMQINVPGPPVAPKTVPKTYLSSANILNPLDYPTVEKWLIAIKMERYKDKFNEAGLNDINQVLQLTEADLKTMGITLSGHLYRITSSIEKAQTQLTRQPSVTV